MDSRGRVRAVGPVSRTQVENSAPAVYELKSKDVLLKHKVDEIGSKVEVLIDGIGTLCHAVKDIQAAIPSSFVVSNSSHVQGCSSGHGCGSPDHSGAYLSSPADNISPARSATASGMPLCSLLNIEGNVIATGKLCTGDLGKMNHGSHVPANLAKVLIDRILIPTELTIKANQVLIDRILIPTELTIKANQFVTTFQDVGIGGFVVHPMMCAKFE